MTRKTGFADPHFHPNPLRGDDLDTFIRRYREAGGWFAGIVSLPPWNYGLEPSWDNYLKVMDLMEKICESFRSFGIKAFCFSGFHPAEVDKLIDTYGYKPIEVVELGFKVIDEVSKRCVEGKLQGLGEVGRQHYKTFADRAVISELILEHALTKVKDHKCPVQMHLENTKSTVQLVNIIIKHIRLSPSEKELIIFHHAKPGMIPEIKEGGYSATIPGTKKQVLEYLYQSYSPVYMLESDYVGGSKNPSNTAPWEMFSMINAILQDEEYLYKIMYENVQRAFHVDTLEQP
ncbi:MAG: TatD family hydrolase [Desulfurococcales archaeon]|nr:TatD family hydrolase [Desulfurococcales archaeon]